jgi:hypothetical protein
MATFFVYSNLVVYFFGDRSSMGTILLIYFTLSVAKLNANEDGQEW